MAATTWLSAFVPMAVAGVIAVVMTRARVQVAALRLQRRMLRFLWVMVAVLAGAIHVLALLVCTIALDAPEELTTNHLAAIGAAASAAALLVWWIRLNHFRDLGRVLEHGRLLRSDRSAEDRRSALTELQAFLQKRRARWPRAPARIAANLELYAALQLIQANHWPEAEDLLKRVPAQHLGAAYQSAHASGMTACRLYQGDRVGARAWFSQVPRPSRDAGIEALFKSTDALFSVLEGRAHEALSIVGNDEEPLAEPTELERTRDHVRAHALAALGDQDRARVILRRLAKRHSLEALERVALVDGPASPLAQVILKDLDRPYR